MLLVSHDDFFERLYARVAMEGDRIDGCVGLFAEREIRKRLGVPNRLFKEPRRKSRRRATGSSTQKVFQKRTVRPEYGSEALVGNVITQLCRANPSKFVSHPGPDLIRTRNVRALFIVTDLIGSGTRVRSYLDSAWRVASVRSWHSYRLIDLHVVAYAATDRGKGAAERHKVQPQVSFEAICPTIETAFDGRVASAIPQLCVKYDPVFGDAKNSVGFDGSGALIAFAHGCPNNAPRLLHRAGKSWKPLFPARVTASSRTVFSDDRDDDTLRSRLQKLKETRLTRGGWLSRSTKEGRWMMLFLASLRRGPRFDEALARKTGLTISEVRQMATRATEWGWLDSKRHLTDEGLSQLVKARIWRPAPRKLLEENTNFYYPKSLRAP